MQPNLDSFPKKTTAKNTYLTIPSTLEKYCKDCTELANSENAGMWVRIHCKAEKVHQITERILYNCSNRKCSGCCGVT